MAKKFGKALLFTALASAVAAGGVALYNKYKASSDDFDDDFLDFDDEDDEDDDFDASVSSNSNREYVSIPRDDANEHAEKTVSEPAEQKVTVDVSIDTSNFKDDDEESADATDDFSFFSDEPTTSTSATSTGTASADSEI